MNIEFLSTVAVITPDRPRAESCISTRWACRLAGRSTSTASGSLVASPLGSAAVSGCSGVLRDSTMPVERRCRRSITSSTLASPPRSTQRHVSSSQRGRDLLHPPREEPWGQTIARLESPEARSSGSRTSLGSTIRLSSDATCSMAATSVVKLRFKSRNARKACIRTVCNGG